VLQTAPKAKKADGTFSSNFKMATYQPESNLYLDTCLGWGIADTYINHYFAFESTKKAYLKWHNSKELE
jgi:hypothetical protein